MLYVGSSSGCLAEDVCRQLAQVVAALLATAFPGTPAGTSSSTTASSNSSSTPNGGHTAAPSAEQQASLALVFDHLRLLLLALVDVVGMVSCNHWLLRSKAVPSHFMC